MQPRFRRAAPFSKFKWSVDGGKGGKLTNNPKASTTATGLLRFKICYRVRVCLSEYKSGYV